MLEAWKEFRKGKRAKLDVLEFQSGLIYQSTRLHEELKHKTYLHGGYKHFRISDPKPRDINKASVRDRLLHHALYRKLYPYFDKKFIADSYSCRIGKGTHKAVNRLRAFAYRVSKNNTRTCWILKCDIKKFFASINHDILFAILERYIPNPDVLWLLRQVVGSFASHNTLTNSSMSGCVRGLPLGNLTSQLLVNVYMNEFDQSVKHKLKVKYYIRYSDDFVLLSHDKQALEKALSYMKVFLRDELKLQLHPDKVFIKTVASGVDFLGWVHFPNHRVLRTTTKRRMFRKVEETGAKKEVLQSYTGLLSHGNARRLAAQVQKLRKE